MKLNDSRHSKGTNSQFGHKRRTGLFQPDLKKDWRCNSCGKLLGRFDGKMMHIRRNPVEFTAGFPITARCPNCNEMNLKDKA